MPVHHQVLQEDRRKAGGLGLGAHGALRGCWRLRADHFAALVPNTSSAPHPIFAGALSEPNSLLSGRGLSAPSCPPGDHAAFPHWHHLLHPVDFATHVISKRLRGSPSQILRLFASCLLLLAARPPRPLHHGAAPIRKPLLGRLQSLLGRRSLVLCEPRPAGQCCLEA